MEKLLEKLSKYHILVNLIPGIVFLSLVDLLDIYDLKIDDVFQNIFLSYFTGMTLSRIGSVIIEPIFKTIRIVKYAPYQDYLNAVDKDKNIPELLEDNNMYRTFVATLFLILFMKAGHLIPVIQSFMASKYAGLVVIVFLLVLYVLAYRKQTSYIRKRVNKVNNKPVE
jgi:hypothetical protein